MLLLGVEAPEDLPFVNREKTIAELWRHAIRNLLPDRRVEKFHIIAGGAMFGAGKTRFALELTKKLEQYFDHTQMDSALKEAFDSAFQDFAPHELAFARSVMPKFCFKFIDMTTITGADPIAKVARHVYRAMRKYSPTPPPAVGGSDIWEHIHDFGVALAKQGVHILFVIDEVDVLLARNAGRSGQALTSSDVERLYEYV